MTHIDDESLALAALGSAELSADEARHLAECGACSDELEALRRTVVLGKDSQGVALEQPSAAVWSRIEAEIAGSAGTSAAPTLVGAAPAVAPPTPLARPRGADRARRSAPPRRPDQRSSSAAHASSAARPSRRRPVLWIAMTAVVAVLAAIGGVVASPYLRPTASTASTVVERTSLEALPGWGGARGTATLTRSAAGHLSLTIDMTPGSSKPATVAGPLREVWLMKQDLSGLVSLGFLTEGGGTFAVPDGVDVSTYDLVDISAQAADGVPAHSGQSIMRGRLT